MHALEEHYDYILFENYQLATHHLYDVKLIAKMLQSQGVKVAIFDLYHQFENIDADEVPIINWNPMSQLPQIEWMRREHSKWETIFKSIKYIKQRNVYLKEAKEFVRGLADNFYCGSLYNGMSTIFFDIDKPCYWWGLRSSRMNFHWKDLINAPLLGTSKLIEYHKFKKNPCQRLFVSNPIILEEFVKLGFPRDRISIREERCIPSIGAYNLKKRTSNISFLVIGMLRPEKNIPLTVCAFKLANILDSTLSLIGRSSAGYELTIESSVASDSRIIRRNKYLEYDDFNESFQKAHFVLFADDEGPSCITNGTFIEALINHRPVICPDCQPYKYYIDQYGVGLTYRKGDMESYAETIKKASALGVEYFLKNIDHFLDTILFDKVSQGLMISINKNNEANQ